MLCFVKINRKCGLIGDVDICSEVTYESSESSDMWATGATIIELYTGVSYWQFSDDDYARGTDMFECLLEKVKCQEQPRILQQDLFTDHVPCNVQCLLAQCLLYDAKIRPSALAIIAAMPSFV